MSDKTNPKKETQTINIEIDEAMAEGTYSNLVIVNNSATEFVLDFINVMPGNPKSKVKSRIILTPVHAKKLMQTLKNNIKYYEQEFGKIDDLERQTTIPISFGPEGQA